MGLGLGGFRVHNLSFLALHLKYMGCSLVNITHGKCTSKQIMEQVFFFVSE
jgi:hypothetical protein